MFTFPCMEEHIPYLGPFFSIIYTDLQPDSIDFCFYWWIYLHVIGEEFGKAVQDLWHIVYKYEEENRS